MCVCVCVCVCVSVSVRACVLGITVIVLGCGFYSPILNPL